MLHEGGGSAVLVNGAGVKIVVRVVVGRFVRVTVLGLIDRQLHAEERRAPEGYALKQVGLGTGFLATTAAASRFNLFAGEPHVAAVTVTVLVGAVVVVVVVLIQRVSIPFDLGSMWNIRGLARHRLRSDVQI